MSKNIKHTDLEGMVKSMLGEALKRKALENKIKKLNEEIASIDYDEPEFVETEHEIYPGKAIESGSLGSVEEILPYLLDDEVNLEYDYLEVGADYDGAVHGSYSPATRYSPSGDVGDPAEYPETEVTINDVFVKNQKNDSWEKVDDNHVIFKVDPDFKKNFESKYGDDIAAEVERNHGDRDDY